MSASSPPLLAPFPHADSPSRSSPATPTLPTSAPTLLPPAPPAAAASRAFATSPAVAHALPDSALVQLNIGGHRYCTTAGTLRSRGDNYFGPLLSGRFAVQRDETGAIFVDRNGRYFEPILDYLRTGTFALPSSLPWRAVAAEAEFFLIPGVFECFRDANPAMLLVSGGVGGGGGAGYDSAAFGAAPGIDKNVGGGGRTEADAVFSGGGGRERTGSGTGTGLGLGAGLPIGSGMHAGSSLSSPSHPRPRFYHQPNQSFAHHEAEPGEHLGAEVRASSPRGSSTAGAAGPASPYFNNAQAFSSSSSSSSSATTTITTSPSTRTASPPGGGAPQPLSRLSSSLFPQPPPRSLFAPHSPSGTSPKSSAAGLGADGSGSPASPGTSPAVSSSASLPLSAAASANHTHASSSHSSSHSRASVPSPVYSTSTLSNVSSSVAAHPPPTSTTSTAPPPNSMAYVHSTLSNNTSSSLSTSGLPFPPPPASALSGAQLPHFTSTLGQDDSADLADLNALSLRERLASRHIHTREAFVAFVSCMRAVHRAASEGAAGVTLVLGEPEGAITGSGGGRQGQGGAGGVSCFRRYQRPRFVERLQVVTERVLETMMGSEAGRETLYRLLVERGFAVRFLSVPCMVTSGPQALADSTFHDGMLVYWGSVPLDHLLTATRKDVFSL